MVQSLTRRLRNGLFLSPACGSCYLSHINRLLLRDLGLDDKAVFFSFFMKQRGNSTLLLSKPYLVQIRLRWHITKYRAVTNTSDFEFNNLAR